METQEIKKDKAGNIIDHTGDYLDTFFKVSLSKVTRKASNIVSGAISIMIVCILGMFILFFAGFAAAWWLGDIIESRVAGFLLIALFYFILTLIIIVLRKNTIFPFIRNMLIRKMYE